MERTICVFLEIPKRQGRLVPLVETQARRFIGGSISEQCFIDRHIPRPTLGRINKQVAGEMPFRSIQNHY
jgi:hypothetical protein